jgi:hypothetical protein
MALVSAPPLGQDIEQCPWHALGTTATATRLEVDPSYGLSMGEVRVRLASCGENRLTEKPPRS